VDRGRVLQHDEVLAFGAPEPQLADGGRAVGEEPVAVVLVDPGVGHDLGPVEGADIALVRLDHRVDHVAGDEALLDQERLDGRHPALDGAGLGGVVPVVPGLVGGHVR
jgi:hypothetical protein